MENLQEEKIPKVILVALKGNLKEEELSEEQNISMSLFFKEFLEEIDELFYYTYDSNSPRALDNILMEISEEFPAVREVSFYSVSDEPHLSVNFKGYLEL